MNTTSLDSPDLDFDFKNDFDELLKKCEGSIENIDKFVETVTNQLTNCELSNVDFIKCLSDQYHEIDTNLNECITTVEMYERELISYERSVVNIRSNFDQLELFSGWENKHTNQVKLYEELKLLMKKLDIDPRVGDSFFTPVSTASPEEMFEFVNKLVDACRGALPPGFAKLEGIKNQIKEIENFSYAFSESFISFMKNLIKDSINNHGKEAQTTSVHSHISLFNSITPYSPLMKQMKLLNAVGYSEVYAFFCDSFNELYSREWQQLSDSFLKSIPSYENPEGGSSRVSFHRDHADMEKRSEQFSNLFKMFLQGVASATKETGECGDQLFGFTSITSEDPQPYHKRVVSGINELGVKGGEVKIRGMLRSIFSFIEGMTLAFLDECKKKDPFYLITASIVITSYSTDTSNTDFFINFLFNLNTKLKNLFTNFFSAVESSIEDEKPSRKQKQSSLSCVNTFQEFLSLCEALRGKKKEKVPYLIEGYQSLLRKVTAVVERVCFVQESKMSKEIYLMENLYNLEACLSNAHVPELVEDRKRIRHQYQNSVKFFAFSILLKSFGKLNFLVEEIDKKNQSNESQSNIETWVVNNKHDFKKSAKECSLKEVKKSVKSIYERLTKHFSDVALLSVVWKSMQQEIIEQLKKIESYISKYCVRVPKIRLDFNSDDIYSLLLNINETS